jgi:hypothetical protein
MQKLMNKYLTNHIFKVIQLEVAIHLVLNRDLHVNNLISNHMVHVESKEMKENYKRHELLPTILEPQFFQ